MSTAKTRVLFISHHLGGGGAERVIAILLEHLDRTLFEPRLLLMQQKRDYTVPGDVRVICLHKKSWYDYPKLVWRLSFELRDWKPDVVLSISRYTNVMTVMSQRLSRAKSRLLLSEHSIPSFFLSQHRDPITLLFDKWMPRWLYGSATRVICVSKHSAEDVHQVFRVPLRKIEVLYNPLDIQKISTLCEEDADHPWFKEDKPVIISIGSLINIKGHPFLLRAFAKVLEKHPSHLMILGRGDQETSLRDLSKRLGIADQVAFLGFQENPFKYAARCSLFVLSSLTEALPMVVLEAMACGIPVVTTRSPGSSEIVTDGVDGIVVPVADEDALAEAMIRVLTDAKAADALARAARRRANDFSVKTVIKRYEQLLSQ